MKPHVLILSSVFDFSTDMVVLRLRHAGVPYARLNREHLADHQLTLDPLTSTLAIDGPSGCYSVDKNLRSVWFRQPVFLRNTPSISLSPDEQLERSQWMAFLRGLCVLDHAMWMNFPSATYIAESKPYQLSVAANCGFHIPKTMITNDANRIRETFPDNLVIKSLDTVLLRDGEDCLFTYTALNPDLELREANVNAAPLLAQHALEEKADLRVTVVGGEVFAVRILRRNSGIVGDWRVVPKSDLQFQDTVLNDETIDRCKMLLNRLGLSFAAIDLIETDKGVFFIEANPTGEWGWLSTAKRPIDLAIASWLENPIGLGGQGC